MAKKYKCNNWLENLGLSFDLGMDRIEELMKSFGNPHKDLKFIHVAGTNGKGSVSAMLYSILSQRYDVGIFTSPSPSFRLRDRIKVDKSISEEELDDLCEKVRPISEDLDCSFFEVITALAILHFKNKDVDIAIMEAGMGGRLDATNIITPEVSIITNVGLEHTQYLGNTIRDIAEEIAGVIKPKVPVVTSAEGEALQLIKGVARDHSVPVYETTPYQGEVGLKGNFQKKNAGLAKKTVGLLDLEVSPEEIQKGLIDAEWPGRFQKIDDIVLDCAHNSMGVSTLVDELKNEGIDLDKTIFVVGILQSKDHKRMIKQLSFASEIVFTRPCSERAQDPKKLSEVADELKVKSKLTVIEDPVKAFEYSKNKNKNKGLTVVTGSTYLVKRIYEKLESGK